jgi:hypothetical protein
MATQKKAVKKGIKVRDLKPSKDAKGGMNKHLSAPGLDRSRGENRSIMGATKGLN